MPCPLQKMSTQKMWRSLFTYCIDQLGFLGKMVNNSLFWEAICSTMDCSNIFTVTIEIYCYQTLLVSQKNQFPATFSSTFHSKESLLPLPWGNPPFASLNQGWGDALILSECTRGFLERMHTLVLYTKALYLAQSRENVKLKVNSSGVRQPHMSGPFSLESHSPLNNGHILAKACTGPKRVYCPIVYSMKSRGKPHRTIMMRYGIMKAPESEEQRGTVGDHTTSSQVCVAVL